eukprot:754660-Hanusia_phi.AAC.3
MTDCHVAELMRLQERGGGGRSLGMEVADLTNVMTLMKDTCYDNKAGSRSPYNRADVPCLDLPRGGKLKNSNG